MFHLLAQWDLYLDRFSDGPMWDPAWHRFDDDHHNCFSFCLRFVNSVLAAEGRSSLSRETFIHSFILPRMRRVSKFTALYHHVERHQYYMVDKPEDGQEGRQETVLQ
ncbi:MKRN2 opposite strand protein-like [Lates japonicus]